jgi:hypothetical protein
MKVNFVRKRHLLRHGYGEFKTDNGDSQQYVTLSYYVVTRPA